MLELLQDRKLRRRLSARRSSLLLATTVAEAGGRGRLFEKPDHDGDGAVSREEWHVAPERHQRKAPKEPVE